MIKFVFCLCPLIVLSACGNDAEQKHQAFTQAESCQMCGNTAGLNLLGYETDYYDFQLLTVLCKEDLVCEK